ncbi:855_t:CDS:2, partial [Racocetra persica]
HDVLTKMSTKDLTKPFYYESNSESIKNFVDDYEGYAAMKDWNKTKIRLVKDIKTTILKSAKSKYDIEMKIERLMNLKLNEDESIVSYTNRFDVCAKKVKNEVAIVKQNIGQYNRGRINLLDDLNIDDLADAFFELKICQVSQDSQSEKGAKRIDKLESTINELTKLVKDIANNKSQFNPNQQNRPS